MKRNSVSVFMIVLMALALVSCSVANTLDNTNSVNTTTSATNNISTNNISSVSSNTNAPASTPASTNNISSSSSSSVSSTNDVVVVSSSSSSSASSVNPYEGFDSRFTWDDNVYAHRLPEIVVENNYAGSLTSRKRSGVAVILVPMFRSNDQWTGDFIGYFPETRYTNTSKEWMFGTNWAFTNSWIKSVGTMTNTTYSASAVYNSGPVVGANPWNGFYKIVVVNYSSNSNPQQAILDYTIADTTNPSNYITLNTDYHETMNTYGNCGDKWLIKINTSSNGQGYTIVATNLRPYDQRENIQRTKPDYFIWSFNQNY